MTSPRKIDSEKEGGVWVVNMAQFRMAHGERDAVVFDPKQPTCIKMDDWIKRQGEMFAVVEDPFAPVPESPVINESPLKDSKTGKPATGVGTGPEGTGNADDVRSKREAAKK